jgi:solute carrier family 35 protein C2
MIIQGLMSYLALEFVFPSMKSKSVPLRQDYWFRVVPCGVATALDIGLSNSSMKVISDSS